MTRLRKPIVVVAAILLAVTLPPGCGSDSMPAPTGVAALSSHYVRVEFDQAAPAASPNDFTITAPNGDTLDIHAAMLSDGGMAVILTTNAQQPVEYELAVANGSSAGSRMAFGGSIGVEPYLHSAVALDDTHILLRFSESMNSGAQDTAFDLLCTSEAECRTTYAITPTDVKILSAVAGSNAPQLGNDGTNATAVLTTTPQRDAAYTVKVTNVTTQSGNKLIDPTYNTVTVRGISPDDRMGPSLTAAVSTSDTTILLSFDEPLQEGSDDPRNFQVCVDDGDDKNCAGDSGLTVVGATMTAANTQILLTTTPQAAGAQYTVVVENVVDQSGDVILQKQCNAGSNHIGAQCSMGSECGSGGSCIAVCDSNSNHIDELCTADADCGPAGSCISVCDANSGGDAGLPCPNNGCNAPGQCIDICDENSNHIGNPCVMNADCGDGGSCTQVCDSNSNNIGDLCATDNECGTGGTCMTSGYITVTFPGTPSLVGGLVLPRVVGAASVSNTEVVVTFSKAMNSDVAGTCDSDPPTPCTEDADCPVGSCVLAPGIHSAANSGNYIIVQESVNPEAGALQVLSADWLGLDHTAVKLTTRSQNELTYVVTVVNVQDQQGNQLAPSSLLADPASAVFPGSPPTGSGIDTDGDGLTDNEEQRGWVVYVVLSNGEVILQREVTSDPTEPDTDGDGLPDADEKRRSSDPRDADTDDDQLGDAIEVGLLFSSPTNQDTDGDGISDPVEANVYSTALYLADTDGDGFDDGREVLELNKDPRVADLPKLRISIGDMALRIDERFTDSTTQSELLSSSTTTSLSRSSQTQFSTSDTSSTQASLSATAGFQAGFTIGSASSTVSGGVTGSVTGGFTQGSVHQVDQQSAQAAQEDFQSSLEKSREFQTSVTREVVGASIDSNLILQNASDVAFTLDSLEISALLPSRQRDRYVPVATMLPSSELISGADAVYNLGPFEEKGPIIISNQEVFPTLVDDLMRNPRGLIFEVANYNVTDEFGRNIAFQQQEVQGRTIQLTIDAGDGTSERRSIAINGAFGNRCNNASINVGDFCREDADCQPGICVGDAGSTGDYCSDDTDCPALSVCNLPAVRGTASCVPGICVDDTGNTGAYCEVDSDCDPNACDLMHPEMFFGGFDDDGRLKPLPMDYVLQKILRLAKNPTTPDAIVAGPNGIANTSATGDDIQVRPFGDFGLDSNSIVVLAGGNGVLDTTEAVDDEKVVTRGYQTSATCDENTDPRIVEPFENGNGRVDTPLVGNTDVYAPGIALGDMVEPGTVIVLPGSDEILQTVPAGDDEFRGPGEPCFGNDARCLGGACAGPEVVVRIDSSFTGTGLSDIVELDNDPNRFWQVLATEDLCNNQEDLCEEGIPAGGDFGDFPLRASQQVTLTFGQDIDRDGIFARTEWLFNSSDTKKDTDDDTLSDRTEIRDGWTVAICGRFPDEQVFSSPAFADSDFDGLQDAFEKQCKTDPSIRDTDGDGILDTIELGISMDLDQSSTISIREQGYGRCCDDAVGSSCAAAPVLPCRDVSDCFSDPDFPTCAPYADATPSICDNNPELNCTTDSDCPDSGRCVFTLADSCPAEIMLSCEVPTAPTRLDPRNPDTDGDGIDDGLEFELFKNPLDPSDGEGASDADQDGLTDLEEQIGWCVAVTLCSNTCPGLRYNGTCEDTSGCDKGTDCADCGSVSLVSANPPPECEVCTTPGNCVPGRRVFSSPSNADTDFDGLPDIVEMVMGSDPTNPDTDGDNLPDYDEFNDFGEFAGLNFQHEGFRLVEGDSRKLGTSLTKQDSDGDRLSDQFELIQGWRVIVTGQSPVDHFADPLFKDSDLDGLTDLEEYLGADGIPQSDPERDSGDALDPTDPDTDGDTRPDGVDIGRCGGGGSLCGNDCDCVQCFCLGGDKAGEDCDNDGFCTGPGGGQCASPAAVCLGSDPLLPDVSVRVNILEINRLCDDEDGYDGSGEWNINVSVRRPLQNEETVLLDPLRLTELLYQDHTFSYCADEADFAGWPCELGCYIHWHGCTIAIGGCNGVARCIELTGSGDSLTDPRTSGQWATQNWATLPDIYDYPTWAHNVACTAYEENNCQAGGPGIPEEICCDWAHVKNYPFPSPERAFCMQPNVGYNVASRNINCEGTPFWENDLPPVSLEGAETTFSLPLGHPFAIDVQIFETDGCNTSVGGAMTSSCSMSETRSYDSAALLGQPYQVVTLDLQDDTEGSGSTPQCSARIVYEIMQAPFTQEFFSEAFCQGSLDDDSDGLVDCLDDDCDYSVLCETGEKCNDTCTTDANCPRIKCIQEQCCINGNCEGTCDTDDDCPHVACIAGGCDDDGDGAANCLDVGCTFAANCETGDAKCGGVEFPEVWQAYPPPNQAQGACLYHCCTLDSDCPSGNCLDELGGECGVDDTCYCSSSEANCPAYPQCPASENGGCPCEAGESCWGPLNQDPKTCDVPVGDLLCTGTTDCVNDSDCASGSCVNLVSRSPCALGGAGDCVCTPVCGQDDDGDGLANCDDPGCAAAEFCLNFQSPPCGDGTLDTAIGEVCDDGNNIGGDGCSGSCTVESAWTCTADSPSICTPE